MESEVEIFLPIKISDHPQVSKFFSSKNTEI